MSNDDFPQRKHPAHGVLYIEGQPTNIFDTVCTANRQPWLANELVHQCLRDVWQDATAWLLGRYVIMPDHIHFFAAATESSISFDAWVRYWKSQFTKKFGCPQNRWQADHWDVRMRNETIYEEKWHYVLQNPVRGGLVSKPEDWSFQGAIYDLRW